MKRLALYLSGPLLVALLAPLVLGAGPLYPILLIVSIPLVLFFTLFVAAPLFLVGAKKFGIRAPVFMGLAFVAGFISYSICSLPFSTTHYSVAGVEYVVDGNLTVAGWRSVFTQSIAVGIASIPGGLLWWLGARIPLERTPRGA